MARFHSLARFVVTETLFTLCTAGGCALGIAGVLFTVSHVLALFVRPLHGIPSEIALSLVLLAGGIWLYRLGRRIRS